ncbi:hypothetical protein EFA46_015320 (plasmid) [Halarchaeum sp. CBA1220]|uniref:hypothetical protein n=1 Tax=Halarchaeum sp. CBA1220 TaxID=1853682 RepID=UPI0011CE4BE3|nr:hypothetical protein [Halarchaeum sp. CBA1220]QLC35630.1 hypothetical protein EFA46_015320 [Halarchaeum sp. CBA1220]
MGALSTSILREIHIPGVVGGNILLAAVVLNEAGASGTEFRRGCFADTVQAVVVAAKADPAGEFAHRVELADERTASVRGDTEAADSVERARGDRVATWVFVAVPDVEEASKVVAAIPVLPEDIIVFLGERDLLGVRDGVEVGVLKAQYVFWTGRSILGVVAAGDGAKIVRIAEVAALDLPRIPG